MARAAASIVLADATAILRAMGRPLRWLAPVIDGVDAFMRAGGKS
jgi:hypothetical protein